MSHFGFEANRLMTSNAVMAFSSRNFDRNSTEHTLVVQSPSSTQGALVGNVGYYGAVITWIGPQNGSTTTDVYGNYQIAALAAGSYTVTVSAGGCNPDAADITIVAGQTKVQNIRLQCQ
jgi:hypothetical protein